MVTLFIRGKGEGREPRILIVRTTEFFLASLRLVFLFLLFHFFLEEELSKSKSRDEEREEWGSHPCSKDHGVVLCRFALAFFSKRNCRHRRREIRREKRGVNFTVGAKNLLLQRLLILKVYYKWSY